MSAAFVPLATFNRVVQRPAVAGHQRIPPIGMGDQAPRFTLPASTGEAISLDACLSRGPVVLLWYVFDFGRI